MKYCLNIINLSNKMVLLFFLGYMAIVGIIDRIKETNEERIIRTEKERKSEKECINCLLYITCCVVILPFIILFSHKIYLFCCNIYN